MVIADVPHSQERDYIVEFIRTSDRGIIKGYGGNA
jgi:hypothetical protein